MILLGICVVALLIGALRLATERTPLPTGSSYSTQPDGAMGLYAWADSVGAGSRRLQDLAFSTDPPTTLVVLQPESPLDATERGAFDSVAARGGTIVLAGDSLPWLLYARGLGVTVEPLAASPSSFSTPDGLILAVSGRYRLNADAADRGVGTGMCWPACCVGRVCWRRLAQPSAATTRGDWRAGALVLRSGRPR